MSARVIADKLARILLVRKHFINKQPLTVYNNNIVPTILTSKSIFFCPIKQNLSNDYKEENQHIFSESHHDIYLSIIIHISSGSEPIDNVVTSTVRAGQILINI